MPGRGAAVIRLGGPRRASVVKMHTAKMNASRTVKISLTPRRVWFQALGAVCVVMSFNFLVGEDHVEGKQQLYFPQGAYLVCSLFALGCLGYTCAAVWYVLPRAASLRARTCVYLA